MEEHNFESLMKLTSSELDNLYAQLLKQHAEMQKERLLKIGRVLWLLGEAKKI